MVSFNIFKLFKRKKKSKKNTVDSNNNDTKLSGEAAAKEVSKVDKASEKQKTEEHPVSNSHGVENVRYINHRPPTVIIARRMPIRRMPPRGMPPRGITARRMRATRRRRR